MSLHAALVSGSLWLVHAAAHRPSSVVAVVAPGAVCSSENAPKQVVGILPNMDLHRENPGVPHAALTNCAVLGQVATGTKPVKGNPDVYDQKYMLSFVDSIVAESPSKSDTSAPLSATKNINGVICTGVAS